MSLSALHINIINMVKRKEVFPTSVMNKELVFLTCTLSIHRLMEHCYVPSVLGTKGAKQEVKPMHCSVGTFSLVERIGCKERKKGIVVGEIWMRAVGGIGFSRGFAWGGWQGSCYTSIQASLMA